MPPRKLNVGLWITRVLTWDGIVPIAMMLLTWGAEFIGGGQNDWIAFFPIAVPIIAIFVRLYLGFRSISTNHCHPSAQQAQRFLLVFGLILLAVDECALMLAAELPAGNGPLDEPRGLLIFSVLFLTYFLFAVVAMYPGRELLTPDNSEDEFFAD